MFKGGESLSQHCKLWKGALRKIETGLQDDISILSSFSIRSTDSERADKTVEDYFFEEEENEFGNSFERILSNREKEVSLAQTVAETLLYLLLPEEELRSRVVVKVKYQTLL
jgi:hypothetical protein